MIPKEEGGGEAELEMQRARNVAWKDQDQALRLCMARDRSINILVALG